MLINDGKDRVRPKLVEPRKVGAAIMQGRLELAQEFQTALAAVPAEHKQIIAAILNLQFLQYVPEEETSKE